ncbi:MAG: mechanosensitive ion channel family protein [Erysipelotrichaceae bacterium]|nr:mechanosensitive ion channel family protein [Erysipelotrichaceae bacterium]
MIGEINWKEVFSFLKINLNNLVGDFFYIVFVILMSAIIMKLITTVTTRAMNKAKEKGDDPKAKSFITFLTLLRSVSRYAVYFIAFCLIINQLGYGSVLSNVITAAGVGALVISLGAQSVISDMIAGAFILFERQFNVGDFVQINEYSGTVSAMAMRCTYLDNWKGERIIIPNGQIKTVINYSGKFNMAIVDVPTPYEEDSDRIIAILKEEADRYYEENKKICYDKPQVLAIASFDESAVTMSIQMKAKGRNHFKIQRDLRLAIKKRFDKEGISIPYNQIVVHNEG